MANTEIKTSTNHIEFIGDYEYFLENGHLYRAHIDNAIDYNGFRCGRWEAPPHMIESTLEAHRELFK